MTRANAAAQPVPPTHVEADTGVDPAAIDYVLDHLRPLCVPYQVTELRVRMSRTGLPAPLDAVLTDVVARLGDRPVTVRAVGEDPRSSVDHAADHLAARLAAVPRKGSFCVT